MGIEQRHARDTINFLTTKVFGTEELYDRMSNVLPDFIGFNQYCSMPAIRQTHGSPFQPLVMFPYPGFGGFPFLDYCETIK